MKKIILGLLLIFSLVAPTSSYALIPCQVNQGCTGDNTITGIPYGTGTAPLSIVTVGSGLSFAGGTLSATGSSPLTTKGDLFTFTTVNARLPVGTNGQLLSADNTASTGLKWITASGTGTVTSVASADGSITVTNPTAAVDLAVVKAPILSTARTIGGVSFNGSANITVASATGGFTVSGGALKPASNDGTAIGVASTGEWSDLFLADGGVIDWDNAGASITYTNNDLFFVSDAFEFSGQVNVATSLTLQETGAGTDIIALQAPSSIAASYTLTLPVDDGTSNQVLTTNGSGVLSWTTPTTGTVTSVSGTTNRITSTGGATPVIDISASYVGQASITTVGTLSSGAVPASLVTAGTFGTGAYVMDTSLTTPLVLGSSAANGDITINGTSSATKTSSYVILQDTGGKVGIGITAPDNYLQVNADTTTTSEPSAQFAVHGKTDTNKMLAIGFETTANYGWIQATQFGTALKPLILQPNGNNVGIGNTNPGSLLTVGLAGTTIGVIQTENATSGSIKITPPTGALGTVTNTLQAVTDTFVYRASTDTLTNKTYDTAGTGNSFSINGVAATANTGTGAVARATSPTFVTPTLGAATATSVTSSGANQLSAGSTINMLTPTSAGATGPTTNSYNSGYSSTAVGDLVYLDSSATWQKADADASATTYSGMLGVALTVTASGAAATVALSGSMVFATAWNLATIGAPVYMSATAGAITLTAPTTTDSATRIIGWVTASGSGTTKIWFQPSPDYFTHT